MRCLFLAVILCLLSIDVQAALHGRAPATPGGTDYQAYYDDLLDITWIADANLAASNTFGLPVDTQLPIHPYDLVPPSYVGGNQIGSDGLMEPGAALHWLDAMNAANYLGASDWRLPKVVDIGNNGCTDFALQGTDCGWNVDPASGEMAHLYYVTLGNKAYTSFIGLPPPGEGLRNIGPFVNLIGGSYWYGAANVAEAGTVWVFEFDNGAQYPGSGVLNRWAWAVRDGDLALVPAPAAIWLFASALAFACVRRPRPEG